jgi:hypothetical protein
MATIGEGDTVDIDEPVLAMRGLWEGAPDRARLEARFFARFTAHTDLEGWAARAFLAGRLSAVVRALQVVAAGPGELRDCPQLWLAAQDQARALGQQLLAFCAARGINAAEFPEGSHFVDLLSDLDNVAMIEDLRNSGVMFGEQKLPLMQRDACAVVGVNEDYPANVRRRHKHPVKKTG